MLNLFELLIIYGRKRQKTKGKVINQELSQRDTDKHRGTQRRKNENENTYGYSGYPKP